MHAVRRFSVSTRLAAIVLCLVGTWLYLGRVSRAEIIPSRTPLSALPMVIGDRTGRAEPPLDDEVEAVLGVDDYIVRSYRGPGVAPVGLYIGYHDSQRQGDTIHSPLNCLPGAGWQPLEQGRRSITVAGAPGSDGLEAPVEVNRVVIGMGLDRQLVYYWYQSHRRVVASEYRGKVYTVLDAMRYNRTDAALVRVIVPMSDGGAAPDPDVVATEFIQALFPLLSLHFPA